MSNNISDYDFCPNCEQAKHLDVEECPYCGVIYKKASVQAEDFGPKAQMDLDLLEVWQDLLEDYSNQEKHEAFIQQALAKNNLPFASQQYRKLLEVNSQDELAKKMQERILQLAMVNIMSQKNEVLPQKRSGMFYFLLFASVISLVMALVMKAKMMFVLALVFFILMFVAKFMRRSFQ